MIKTIIEALNSKISLVTTLSLAELVEKEDKRYPAIYISKGEYEPISIDKYNGLSYWRVLGTSQSKAESYQGCSSPIERIYTMKLVAVVPKSELYCDDEFSNDRVVDELVANITGEDSVTRKAIGARAYSVFVDEYTTDRVDIEDSEYVGLDVKIRYNYVYVSLDVSVNIIIDESCLTPLC